MQVRNIWSRRQTLFLNINQVPEGTQLLWMEIKSSFVDRGGWMLRGGGYVRDKFVL
jgi:hypothetical protein